LGWEMQKVRLWAIKSVDALTPNRTPGQNDVGKPMGSSTYGAVNVKDDWKQKIVFSVWSEEKRQRGGVILRKRRGETALDHAREGTKGVETLLF